MFIIIQMVIGTNMIIEVITLKEKVFIILIMVIYIKEILNVVARMEREFFVGIVEIERWAIIIMINK